MLLGAYKEDISIGAPEVWPNMSGLEVSSIGYNPPGLDSELGLVLDDSEHFYRSVGLDGLGSMGDLAGFFSSIKHAISHVSHVVQNKVKSDVRKLQKLRNKVTPKVLQKLEHKVLNAATKAAKLNVKLLQKTMPTFMRKPTMRLVHMAEAVASKATPPMVKKVMSDIAIVSPPGMGLGRQKFLAWLHMDNPELFTAVVGKAVDATQKQAKMMMLPGVHGLGQGTTTAAAQPSIWDNIVNAAKTIIPTVLQTKAQSDLYKLQLQRAQNGQPPLNAEAIAPVIRTQVGVAPQTMQTMSSTMLKMGLPIAIGGGVLLAAMALKGRGGRRRR